MKERELSSVDLAGLERRASELETELKEMPGRIQVAYQELFNLRFRLATRQLDDTSQVRKARRQVARLKTAMSEMEKEQALIAWIRRQREGQ